MILDKYRGNVQRKPLRTITELAAEFDVTRHKLSRLMTVRNGPKPVMQLSNKHTARNTWYEPTEVRAWWENLDSSLK